MPAPFGGAPNDVLLDDRDLLGWHFDAEVAASHHHALSHLQDLLHVVIAFGLFDLRDDRHVSVLLAHARAQVPDILGMAHK